MSTYAHSQFMIVEFEDFADVGPDTLAHLMQDAGIKGKVSAYWKSYKEFLAGGDNYWCRKVTPLPSPQLRVTMCSETIV
jgi:hypothetical protein